MQGSQSTNDTFGSRRIMDLDLEKETFVDAMV
jgi:hypothetical protein